MTAAIDLHQGIVTLWDDNGLNDLFKAYWSSSVTNEFPVLHDQEASAAQPFPYCVFVQNEGSTLCRMTNRGNDGRFENRNIPFEFHIHTRSPSGTKSAKQVAMELADEVMKIFGGHPTEKPKIPDLQYGNVIQSQYQSDNGMRDGAHEWMWIIRYVFLVDVPVAA